MVLLISSCSFHSAQYDMIKSLFSEPEFSIQTWNLTWRGKVVEVFPISSGAARVIFINESGVKVEFDGWNLVGFEGLPGILGGKLTYRILPLRDAMLKPTAGIKDLDSEIALLTQNGDENEDQIIFCGPWQQNDLPLPGKTSLGKNFSQNCFFSSSEPFQNAMIMDEQSKILSIETYLLPSRQVIRLSYNG
jgi:hypothetical protein